MFDHMVGFVRKTELKNDDSFDPVNLNSSQIKNCNTGTWWWTWDAISISGIDDTLHKSLPLIKIG